MKIHPYRHFVHIKDPGFWALVRDVVDGHVEVCVGWEPGDRMHTALYPITGDMQVVPATAFQKG